MKRTRKGPTTESAGHTSVSMPGTVGQPEERRLCSSPLGFVPGQLAVDQVTYMPLKTQVRITRNPFRI